MNELVQRRFPVQTIALRIISYGPGYIVLCLSEAIELGNDLNAGILWWGGVLLLFASYIAASLRLRSPSLPIFFVFVASLALPTWPKLETGLEPIEVKSTVAILILVTYSFLPGATFPWRLTLADCCMLGLISSNLVTDFYHQGFSPSILAFAYVEWIVPYLLGRLALQSTEYSPGAILFASVVGACISLIGIIDAFSSVNAYELIAGERPIEGAPLYIYRWGFRRSYGPCMHPLYLGVLLSWFWAFAFGLVPLTLRKKLPKLTLLLIPICLLGIFSTMSRGPLVAILLVPLSVVFLRFRKARLPIAFAAVAACATFGFFGEGIQQRLDQWSGETAGSTELKKVYIDQQYQSHSSIRARTLLWPTYRHAIWLGGLLGHGTEKCSVFPPNVPLPGDMILATERVWSVDNTYILLTLRFGWLGIACFCLLIVAAAYQLYLVAESDESELVTSLFAALVALAILISSVWMPLDFGYPFLFTLGASSGLYHATHYRLRYD
jgi:hypothetical protein